MTTSDTGLKRVRIFVSSPGDVRAERKITEDVLGFLQAEFSSYLCIDPLFWENEVQFAHNDFQGNIEPPSQSDLFICILWSRLGTRLHPQKYTREDGSPYLSGTEFEFEDAVAAFKKTQFPHLMLFKSEADVHIPDNPPNEFEERIAQRNALHSFFEKWTKDEEHSDVYSVGFNIYKDTAEFKAKLTKYLRQFFQGLLPEEVNLQQHVAWKGSPFRGLEHFDYEHAPIFKGRAAVTGEILIRLKQQFRAQKPFMLIGGSSGVGKSSLVRAGLLRLLLNHSQEWNTAAWHYAELRPSDIRAEQGETDFADVLARALTQTREAPLAILDGAQTRRTPPSALPELLEYYDSISHLGQCIRQDIERVTKDIKACLAQKATQYHHKDTASTKDDASLQNLPQMRLCLLLDQMEEFFTTACGTPESINAFFQALRVLVEERALVVISTIRADYLSFCEEIPHLQYLKDGNSYYHLSPPSTLDIGSIIREPAQAAGVLFEKNNDTSLDEVIRMDALGYDSLGQGTTVLPLLEFTLTELYEKAKSSQKVHPLKLTFAHYEEMGGLQGAIATKADATFTAFQRQHPTQASTIFSQVMRCLVTGTQDGVFSRQKALREKVDSIDGGTAFVDAFIAARLLTTDTDEKNNITLSIVHEALLHHWQYLRQWLEHEREYFAMLQRVQAAHILWQKENEPKDLLLAEGKSLRDAEYLCHEHTKALNTEEKRFIALSRKHAERQKRRLYMLIAALIVGFTLALYMFYQSTVQEKKTLAAKDAAEELISFMLYDLYKELKPIGRLDIIEDLHKEVQSYYDRQGPARDFIDQYTRNSLLSQQANTLAALGKTQEALAIHEKDLESTRELVAQHPDALEIQDSLASTLNSIGDIQREHGKNQEALKNYEESLSIKRALAKKAPQDLKFLNNITISLNDIARIYEIQGKRDTALTFYKESLAIARDLVKKEPHNTEWLHNIHYPLQGIGNILVYLGKSSEALPLYKENLSISRQLLKTSPNNTDLQNSLISSAQGIGRVFMRQKKYAEAIPYFKEALDISRKQVAYDPKNTKWKQGLIISLERMGDAWKEQNNISNALKLYTEGLDIAFDLSTLNPNNLNWIFAINTLLDRIGTLWQKQGDVEKALTFYQESLEVGRLLLERESNNPRWKHVVIRALNLIGTVLHMQGKYQEALPYYKEKTELFREVIQENPKNDNHIKEFSDSLVTIGERLQAQGYTQLALEAFQEVLTLQEKLLLLRPDDANVLFDMAITHHTLFNLIIRDSHPKAEPHIQKSIQLFEQFIQSNPPNVHLYKEPLEDLKENYHKLYKEQSESSS